MPQNRSETFKGMLVDLNREVVGLLAMPPSAAAPRPPLSNAPIRGGQAPGRNAPCPCGSGKKFKHCCLNR